MRPAPLRRHSVHGSLEAPLARRADRSPVSRARLRARPRGWRSGPLVRHGRGREAERGAGGISRGRARDGARLRGPHPRRRRCQRHDGQSHGWLGSRPLRREWQAGPSLRAEWPRHSLRLRQRGPGRDQHDRPRAGQHRRPRGREDPRRHSPLALHGGSLQRGRVPRHGVRAREHRLRDRRPEHVLRRARGHRRRGRRHDHCRGQRRGGRRVRPLGLGWRTRSDLRRARGHARQRQVRRPAHVQHR